MIDLAFRPLAALGLAAAIGLTALPVQATDAAFQQALAQEAAKSAPVAAFYANRGYAPIWTGKSGKDRARRNAYFKALANAGDHGLPAGRYRGADLQAALKAARTTADLGRIEAQMSASFLQYARDVQSGILVPGRVDGDIKRQAPRRNPEQVLVAFSKSSARGFLNALPPDTAEYDGLMDEKARLEKLVGSGGWGSQVPGGTLKPGMSGDAVVLLRRRLAAMGYSARGGATYDQALQVAVATFQRDHGLHPDGVAGPGTLGELNRDPAERLQQVVVAMERERWTNLPLGRRHVWVNLPDFSAQIVDNGRVTFETRTVVGQNLTDQRSPEFSDVMEFMVVNPSWNVPHSITTKEYLPLLQEDPNAVSHLQLIDTAGNRVSRGSVNFASYSTADFPYRLKEPPSQGNALGLVKFMFPNQYNIYLHDTPSKSLFARETRAYSHGCIRLAEPFDFAHALLARQAGNPEAVFKSTLQTGRETTVPLSQAVPVHLVYRTAFIDDDGDVQYRRDVYGRDARVFRALSQAGVTLRAS